MENPIKIRFLEFVRQCRYNHHQFFGQMLLEYGEVFSYEFLFLKAHFIVNPTYVKYILFDNRKNYIKAPYVSGTVDNFVGEGGILTTDNHSIWQPYRSHLNILFSEQKVLEYVPLLVSLTDKLLSEWEEYHSQKKPMNLDNAISAISLSALLLTFFGGITIDNERVNYLVRKILHFLSPKGKLFGIVPSAIVTQRKIKRDLYILGEEILRKCLAADAGDNFIKILYSIPLEEKIRHKQRVFIRANALTLLAAGYETTAALLCWTFYYLSLYPQIFNKMYVEINTQIGTNPPTADDLPKLTYTRAILSEVLRLQPPIINIGREAISDDSIGSYTIKKGSTCIIDTYILHRLPEYWQNPEAFDPDRFANPLPRNYEYIYLPFGAGPRSCIGKYFSIMEAMIVVVMVTQRYRLSLTPGSAVGADDATVNKPNTRISVMVESVKNSHAT